MKKVGKKNVWLTIFIEGWQFMNARNIVGGR